MPRRHPDDDLLADLAADVLPADRARAVEAHVMACDRCAGLLEDAERVRALLLSGDPGPVPLDVWRRIEGALAQAQAPASPGVLPPAPSPGPLDHEVGRWSRVARPLDDPHAADDADDADPLDDPERWNGRPVRGTRSGSSISRRDARTGPGQRRVPLLLAAAAVLALVAVVGSVKLIGRNGPSEAALSTASPQSSRSVAPGGAASPSRAVVVRSGRDYRASTLAADAAALLATTSATGSRARSEGTSGRGASPAPAAPGATRLPAVPVPPDTSADDITNPTRLAACLAALGVARDRLVAVDLATYEGREAAILLLTTPDGSGHEVWAVERTCAAGAEGALEYTRLSE